MARNSEIKNEDLGFQIAPMIDVVFVIMLFFMVKAAARQVETEIKSQLPGSAETATPLEGLEALEQSVNIDTEGNISHNDEALLRDEKRSDLEVLKARMKELKQTADDTQGKVLVTITTSPETKYEDVVAVMNTLSYAKITNMTFGVAEE